MVQSDSPELPKGHRTGAGKLRQYRLYFLESVDKLISYSHEFEAGNDEDAIKIAEAWHEGRRAELWCGSHKVKAWEHTRDH